MNYTEAFEKLERYGQTHVLDYYERLTEEGRKKLLDQIEAADLSVLDSIGSKSAAGTWKTIEPLQGLSLEEIAAEREQFTRKGLEAIRAGQVACVLLAGGMGTRLGSDDPKCMYDIGITRPVYIMQRLMENLQEVTAAAGCGVPFLIMTSDRNHDKTVRFMEDHDYFGYDPDLVTFFRQDMAPAADYQGKIYMESMDSMSLSPNGNGGWFSSLQRAGILDRLKEAGVRWLNVFGVDNVLQRIADPCFIGAVIDREKVGVLCCQDGHPAIIEYYEMTDELLDAADEKGSLLYSYGVILNYLFRIRDLEKTLEEAFPVHVVEKKIAYMGPEGETVTPAEPNGYKFELLMIDQIRSLPTCLPYEVDREREFAPIKNKTGRDSVESARRLCLLNGIEL